MNFHESFFSTAAICGKIKIMEMKGGRNSINQAEEAVAGSNAKGKVMIILHPPLAHTYTYVLFCRTHGVTSKFSLNVEKGGLQYLE